MRRETVFVTLSVCITIVAASAIIARGGPLDPPNGPITSTYKTLDEVEPRVPLSDATTPGDADSVYRITSSGSYYLTGDLVAEDGKYGIEIDAAGVTVDLEGFELKGFVFGGTSLGGIIVNGNNTVNVTIRNGSVRSWDGIGIFAFSVSGVTIENVSSSSNGLDGFFLGEDASMTDCVARGNGRHGYNVGKGSVLSRCRAIENDQSGFLMNGTVATDCTAIGNGFTGIGATHCALSSCLAEGNGVAFSNPGISLFGGTATDCIARDNVEHGFSASTDSVLEACLSEGNGQAGFDLFRADMRRCRASGNGAQGVLANAGCIVSECISRSNDLQGFQVLSTGSRIDSNHALGNAGVGIDVDGGDNVIVRNTARGNSGGNYTFVANNDYGQILTNPGAGFVSSNPWANFQF